MAVDPALVGPVAAELMDALAGEYGEDAEIRSILVAVEIDSDDTTQTRWKADPDSSVTVAGLAAQLLAASTAGYRVEPDE